LLRVADTEALPALDPVGSVFFLLVTRAVVLDVPLAAPAIDTALAIVPEAVAPEIARPRSVGIEVTTPARTVRPTEVLATILLRLEIATATVVVPAEAPVIARMRLMVPEATALPIAEAVSRLRLLSNTDTVAAPLEAATRLRIAVS
jgi:hypothetical protein